MYLQHSVVNERGLSSILCLGMGPQDDTGTPFGAGPCPQAKKIPL